MDEKIVFLNQANLAVIEGYKANVEWKAEWTCSRRHEIHVVLTGFSEKGAKDLFNKLKAMNPEEIKGV